METWKHVRAVLLLPFMVTVVIPSTLVEIAAVNSGETEA
jgi:hypothetical protein